MSGTGCAAVIITIATSGGIAGIGDPSGNKSVNTDSLPAETRDAVCAAFETRQLETLEKKAAEPSKARGADRFTYHITVKDAGGKSITFEIPEHVLPPEMLDLIDEM